MPRLQEIAEYLNSYLRVANYPADQGGILRPSERHVDCMGLALEPTDATLLSGVGQLDALWLHRWWGFEAIPLAADAGALGYHRPFDDRLTLSDNPFLVSVLGISHPEPLHAGDGRLIGVIGDVPACDHDSMHVLLANTFGGMDYSANPTSPTIRRVAAVNAMTAALVHDAHARGADLYVTGQIRVPARAAIAETGIGVSAIGHARLERWGLSCLASLLHEEWPELEVRTSGYRCELGDDAEN